MKNEPNLGDKPGKVVPFPDMSHPNHHYGTSLPSLAAWMLLNGGTVMEVQMTEGGAFWHIGFDQDPASCIQQFYAGTGTVAPLVFAKKIEELIIGVLGEPPAHLKLPDLPPKGDQPA